MHPSEVPGFAAHEASRGKQRVPTVPPTLLPGPTSTHLVLRMAAGFIGGVLTLVLLPLPDSWRLVVFLPASIFILYLTGRQLHAFGSRQVEEYLAGYRVRGITMGSAFLGRSYRRAWEHKRVGWDERGLWQLNTRGEAVAPPQEGVLPPGFYPSPHRPGRLQLWTGLQWLTYFEEDWMTRRKP